MEWSGGFTELPIDPVLEKNMPPYLVSKLPGNSFVCKYIPF